MISGYLCTVPVYEYKGWSFEFHSYLGPWPLKKDGNPRKCAGKKFWDIFDEFATLSKEEQETYLKISGGCIKIEENK